MRKQPPLERLVVLPDRILRIDEEVLVVAENVSDHQTNEAKQQILARGQESRWGGTEKVDIKDFESFLRIRAATIHRKGPGDKRPS